VGGVRLADRPRSLRRCEVSRSVGFNTQHAMAGIREGARSLALQAAVGTNRAYQPGGLADATAINKAEATAHAEVAKAKSTASSRGPKTVWTLIIGRGHTSLTYAMPAWLLEPPINVK
jgi:hypothetical protein